jgi:hypothetical protein
VFPVVTSELEAAGLAKGPILSFGCSTGDECFTLRRYLPDALIVGADVSRRALADARARNDDSRITFIRSRRGALSRSGPFAAIFAMSVLCRWPATMTTDDASRVYPFRRFEAATASLDEILTMGGLLVVYNANYRFIDTTTARKYETVPTPTIPDSGFVHLFSPSGRKLSDQHFPSVVFRKTEP